jgi:serine/threonine protein kinase/tetratricopeptide (TPR) repeat protein
MLTTKRSEESIFAEALDRPPEARAAFLDAVCGGDAALRARIEKLLKSHTAAGSFLQALPLTKDEPLAEQPGAIVGSYKLLQQIGEGGMGVVYMAEQEHPVRRRVALKIIKPGMDSRQVVARFEAERQALAMMDHQNIAKVLDAGTTESGRPYFVMELVHGVPITRFCDDNRLTLRQRLELFVPICHAIQHAHQKGVIHRDVKPTNILVTMFDDQPVPKVIDFGVAKAVEQRLTEKTLFTQYGMLVGTFEYMSPEQAEMNAFGVDTRSDIYSLGVLLYELLTGTTPIERARLRDAALVELVRLIKEEEPPRPSVRLSSSGALPTFAAACRTEPTRLPKLVRGELDWIVMKCLEKDRTRRYETVNGLARDVQRYLKDEPVEACPPSAMYRLHKLVRKHRGLLTTVALFAALLVVASIVSSSLAAWAMRSQRQAETALVRERQARQEAVAAKDVAAQAARRLRAATQIANEGIEYYNRNNWSAAHEHFTRAVQIEPGLNTSYIYRGALYTQLGLWDLAAADYDQRFRLVNRVNAQTCFEHALLKIYMGDEPGYRQACGELVRQHNSSPEISTRYCVLRCCLLGPQPVGDPADLVGKSERLVASAHAPWHVSTAGRAHLLAGDFEKAAARCREAIKLGAGSPAGVHRTNYANLAMALHRLGNQAEADDALARAEAARDEWTKSMLDGLVGTMPINWWDWLEFDVHFREAKMLLTGAPPEEDPRLISIHERALATVTSGGVFTFMDAGRGHVQQQAWDQAAASFVKVLDQTPPGYRASSQFMRFGVEMVQNPEVFDRLVALRPLDRRPWDARGRTYANDREWAKASSDYQKSLDFLTEALSHADATTQVPIMHGWSTTIHELATLRLLMGDRAGYRELCARVVELPIDTDNAFVGSTLARTCTLTPDGVSDWSIPLKLAGRAVEKEPRVAWFLYSLGIAQHRAGQDEQAIQTLKKSLEVQPSWVGRGQNYAALALTCDRLGRSDEAQQWLAKTKTWLNKTNRTMATYKFGFAASDYLSDWLCAQVLLAEAETHLKPESR